MVCGGRQDDAPDKVQVLRTGSQFLVPSAVAPSWTQWLYLSTKL